jgi:hypothetical protein
MRRAAKNNEGLESSDALDDSVEAQGVLPEEEFDGFDGTWDFEWVAMIDTAMEEIPWTWIAVLVFVCGMAYSYYQNKAPKE